MINNSTKEFFDRVLLGKYIELKCEIINENQPERLSPEDHIREDTKMVSDSLNSEYK